MNPQFSSKGIPYLPDEAERGAAPPPPPQRSFIVCALLFFTIFAGLQLVWDGLRNTGAERTMIEVLLVKPAVVLVNAITPQVGAVANGRHVDAAGGGLEIVSACTGTEIYFMLTAALLVFPLPWRARIAGIVLGITMVFVLNHLRILALFYAYRAAPVAFDYLHGIVIPVVLILSTSLFVLWWTAGHANESVTAGR